MKSITMDAPLKAAAADTRTKTPAMDTYRLSFLYFMGTLLLSLAAALYFFFAYLLVE